MKKRLLFVPLASLTIAGGPVFAKVFLSVDQARARLFPGATFESDPRTLTEAQAKEIEHASGVAVRNKELKIWKASTGGYFIVDEVVGKHEFIPVALAMGGDGAVKGIEILEYREAYGDQIRNEKWRQQFTGKTPGTELKLDKQIHNISGATLSCKHVTDGVNRWLATYAVAIAPKH